MKEPKPIPQVPAALCGIYPGARVIVSPKCWWADSSQSWHAYPYNVPGEHPYVVRCSDFKYYGSLTLEDMTLPLDSPLAMCHAARWLAGRLGYDPGSTAPLWRLTAEGWLLEMPDTTWTFGPPLKSCLTRYTAVPGIVLEWGQDAEALASACMALAPA